MNVYATLEVEDSEVIKEIYDQGAGAVIEVGFEWYPVISVDTETNLIEVGHPQDLTYH